MERESLRITINMSFFHMVESLESPEFIPFKEPNLETLVESCVTHDLPQSNELEDCRHRESKTSTRKRRKRKTKNKEDAEKRRMTHIEMERNRRRQITHHLAVLKSLMPSSYVQRGDHASIIGGAIDFVKELEQLVQSMEAQKRVRNKEEVGSSELFEHDYEEVKCEGEVKAEKNSEAVAVDVTVIQTHVNLKIQCLRRPGQLIKAIVALEDLRLTVLHLNITSSDATVLYSFNLKSNLLSGIKSLYFSDAVLLLHHR
ncbi:Transcription factor bHLH70, partial [Mucuna pruriens]